MSRTHDQDVTGPIGASVCLGFGDVHVIADDVTEARVALRPTRVGDAIAQDLIDRAEITGDGETLTVHIPDPPRVGAHVGVQVGVVYGDVNINQQVHVGGGGTSYQSGGDLVVHNTNIATGSTGSIGTEGSVDVQVIVPTGSTLDVRAGHAPLLCWGALGALTVSTGHGAVDVYRVRDRAEIKTGHGSVRVDAASQLAIKTGHGGIHVRNTDRLEATSGQGDVTVLQVNDAVINTGRGNIDLTHRGGNLKAKTGMGSITLEVLSPTFGTPGVATLRSGMGSITVTGSRKRADYVVDPISAMGRVTVS